MKTIRNFLVTGLVVVAAAIGVGVWKGLIPPKSGTEGAIGAAKRYTSQQISDTDVQLSDPAIQAFLQSDLFHAIATNPDFRNVVTKDAFKKTVQIEGMLDLAAQDFGHGGSKDFSKAVSSEALKSVTASKDFQKAIKDSKLQNLLANSDFRNIVAHPDFKKAVERLKGAGKDAKASLKDELITKTKEWKALESNADFNEVLANQDFLAAAANTDMAKVIKENSKLFDSVDFNKMLGNKDFQNLVASEDFEKMAKTPEFQNLWASEDFRKAAGKPEFKQLVHADLAAAVAASEDMSKAKPNN